MIKNYIKIAWRNLNKNRTSSFINVFGLALGLAICLLITLFVLDELSYDKYNIKADRIYRINTYSQLNGSAFSDRATPAPMAAALTKNYPQIEKAVRISNGGNMLFKKGNETLVESNSFFADPGLFDMFTLPMISGNPATALSLPSSLVISESVALKYFGSINVIGKTMLVDNGQPLKITGVIKDTPAQSHLHFRFIRTLLDDRDAVKSEYWLSNSYITYMLVRAGTTEQELNRYLKNMAVKYAEPQLQDLFHSTFKELEQKGDYFRYAIIPLKKIHLHSDLSTELEPSGNIQNVYIFIGIALLILLVACVNFMNLSTARSAGRSREVGVRKVLGSNRSNLISQFLIESVLTSFMAMVLAVILVAFLLPFLNSIAGKEIPLYSLASLGLVPLLLLATFLVGLLAGSYPAFFLSAFEPVQVLKGKLAVGFKGRWLRNALVVFQFSTAIILIIGTLVIYSQLNYIRNKDLGYNKEQVLVLQNAYSLGEHAKTFKSEVLQIPGVVSASRLNALPTSQASELSTNSFSKSNSLIASEMLAMGDWKVDAEYVPTMGMQMAEGRNFSPLMPTDSSAVIINETAARLLNFKHPLQSKLYEPSNEDAKQATMLTVIGVIKDFNAGSMRHKTQPIVLRLSKYGDRFAFRIKGNSVSSILKQIKEKYHAIEKMAGQPFMYSFLDEDFDKLYHVEQRTGRIFFAFTFFAILIACLGLFGLATYAAEQRANEIGVRKVLGASVQNIVILLSSDFLKLVFISAVVAFPLGWIVMNQWLNNFAYRTNIGWWVFGVAAFLAVFITLVTTSFRAIKAAIANPVKSLRTE